MRNDTEYFDDAIKLFRRPPDENPDHDFSPPYEAKFYILKSFELRQEWDFGVFKISPSRRLKIDEIHYGFASVVTVNQMRSSVRDPEMYATAVSAILTFILGSLVISPKQLNFLEELSNWEGVQFAVQLPKTIAGPGTDFGRSLLWQDAMYKRAKDFIANLFATDYDVYFSMMRSVRLFQLSLKNYSFDFGAAYLLLVSSIESIARLAVSRDAVKQGHEKDTIWQQLARKDEDIKELLRVYKDARGQNQYLKERYAKFIFTYAPVRFWDQYVTDPQIEWTRYQQESIPWELHYFGGHERDIRPSQVHLEDLTKFIKDTYTYRSKFVHAGEQPPNKGYRELFFEDTWVLDEKEMKAQRILLPTYQLMIAIAQNSISNFLEYKKGTQKADAD